jgi:hypothetical protein
MHQAHRDWADRQVTVSSCFFCSWTFEGSALEGREKAKAHRERKHPEACIRKPRLRRRITKKSIRSAGEEEQIKVDAAEARRLRHDRDFAKVLAKVAKLDSAAESV